MFEKALRGGRVYWTWLGVLIAFVGSSLLVYLYQYRQGLWVTGLSRDVSWGLYIAQFTFMVGVAVSSVMVVLPYYVYNFRAFDRMAVLAQFLAVGSVIVSLVFVTTDLGKPMRLLNVPLHPTLHSMLFWDMVFLTGYLGLNLVIGWTALSAEEQDAPPPGWLRPLIYLSIPWAASAHTITALIYAGTPGREFWLTAIMAPRFLVTAFAAGPALLIILATTIEKLTVFKPGEQAIQKLATITLYALILDMFFLGLEFFTAFYSQIPRHMESFRYLLFGLGGNSAMVPWYWIMIISILSAIALLFIPSTRKSRVRLVVTCTIAFTGLWIDKGFTLVVAAFIPNTFNQIKEYPPTSPEIMITLGIYCLGALIVTVLYKVAISVKGGREEGVISGKGGKAP
ncbi:MAG: polysulfide reductase NrfD [Deltaproteobacteria bacterium]